ncbi:major facilitator superfamily domain-containing protein [Aspergillus karnatakaensis]|uniref:major facilitator superfamily domain-containing protein n=1 Tax=Aspergillus karnatakaensis TaxID=1810916 RepID=UPI003CCDB114
MADKENADASCIEDIDERQLAKGYEGLPVKPASLAALSEEEYRKISRRATLKLDAFIMPCMVIMYIFNYLDRQNIAAAKLAGIEEDLGISDVQYQTCVSILFVGYILMQVPSNIIVGKIKWPGVYICCAMAIWGLLSALTALVHNFAGLMASRFFLGFIEAVFFPGALFYMSLFYTRKQYALRTAILFSGSQLGNAFGGLFAIGILKLNGRSGMEGWRWLFLIEGVLTIALAILIAFLLPNKLHNLGWGFTQVEREWLVWNFEEDQGQADNVDEISAMKGVVLAVTDPKTWLLMATLYSVYIAAAVSNFFPSVVATLGYGRNETYALTAPPYILCVIVMVINGFHSDKKQERYWHIVCPMLICLAANIIAVSTLNTAARYVAMMLMPGSFYGATAVILSWVAGSLSQPAIKRASAIALINAVCNTPNVWCSYLYGSAPRYLVAFLVNLAASALAIVAATATRIYLRRENRKLDIGVDTGRNGPTAAQQAAGFRYTL